MGKKLTVELPPKPNAGHYSPGPNGDNAYDDAIKEWHRQCWDKIYEATGGEVEFTIKYREEEIIRHIAEVEVNTLQPTPPGPPSVPMPKCLRCGYPFSEHNRFGTRQDCQGYMTREAVT